jgi:Flp pilus assembly protein TadB
MPFAGLLLGELASPGTLAALLSDPRSALLVLAAAGLAALAFAVVGRLARVAS